MFWSLRSQCSPCLVSTQSVLSMFRSPHRPGIARVDCHPHRPGIASMDCHLHRPGIANVDCHPHRPGIVSVDCPQHRPGIASVDCPRHRQWDDSVVNVLVSMQTCPVSVLFSSCCTCPHSHLAPQTSHRHSSDCERSESSTGDPAAIELVWLSATTT